MQPVSVNQWMPFGRDDLDVLHPDAAQFAGHVICRSLHIRLVLWRRADAGNPQQVFQLTEKTLLVLARKINCRGSH